MNNKAGVPFLACLFGILLLIGVIWNGYENPASQIMPQAEAQPQGDADAESSAKSEDEQNLDSTIFAEDKVVDVKITLDADDFQDMLDNASNEEMKTASVDYNGVRIDNIGIRTKGNLSLRSVVSMPDSDRYSFKLSFDEFISSQNLFGISKINLNNNYSDASSMREFLTYELAEKMGLPVPKHSYVNIYINGERYGTYLAVEQIGSAYLERYFDNSTGALYKAEMTGNGGDLQWISDNADDYSALAKKSKGNDDTALVNMIDELNNGSDYESVLDVEEVLKYIALNVATQNTDSYIGQNKQNYYLYEQKGVFSVLPWDYNMAFGGLGSSSLLIDEPTQGALAERPLVAKLLEQEEYKEKYHAILQETIDVFLQEDIFHARVQELYALISEDVEKDPNAFYTFDEFKQSVEALKTTNSTQVEQISQQLDGTIPSSGDGSGSGGGMGMPGDGGGAGGNAGGGAAGGVPDGAPGGFAPGGDAGGNNAANGDAPAAFNGQMPPEAQNGQTQNGQDGTGVQDVQNGGQMGQFPGRGNGQMPGGMNRPDMGGERGGMPGMNGGMGEPSSQGSAAEAMTAGIAVLILILACVFVKFFRRHRL
ncbi:spore coat protein CotH [Paenibacillus lemnae]|uniref:Spore coat protein CotH n=2 Tax=Paenibacillus lemnae TaxID=1330551 RepID=A0A848M952_PAELE|nr:spore coat protein CotH [Paenibacillus lemnae]